VGLEIRFVAPAEAGATFTYSVQREDGAYFDFEQGVYRQLRDTPQLANTRPLIHNGDAAIAHFDHMKLGERYIIRITHGNPDGKITYEWPITADADSCGEGGEHVEPSYRHGKKFLDGKTIEAKFRLTVHGDDGFTVHTATLWEDGTTSCNCPRWGPHKRGEQRRCPHSIRAATLTANIDETREQPGPTPAAPATSPFRRRSRTVDT
jgi:hypothetical protein